MCRESWMVLLEELNPIITKKKTGFCNAVSFEAQVAVTLYYLAEEGQMRKIVNACGLGKLKIFLLLKHNL